MATAKAKILKESEINDKLLAYKSAEESKKKATEDMKRIKQEIEDFAQTRLNEDTGEKELKFENGIISYNTQTKAIYNDFDLFSVTKMKKQFPLCLDAKLNTAQIKKLWEIDDAREKLEGLGIGLDVNEYGTFKVKV